ncbi:septum formation family protein [Actinomadura algeriensis]|uniref:Uncharacterized protein n=1 Tax=Actinomadura algeriensis TaxID=1679523 RepID=A0ABR9JWR2_9ACTN|nr:septum formation family protein [Actinomadura algeriensis]MBE1535009.1 hypothetical protein [Actinomadura algeriensis]
MAASTFSVDRNAPGQVTDGGKVHITTLREGGCYTGFALGDVRLAPVEAVPCTEPHRGEVVARLPVSSSPMDGGAICRDRSAYLSKSRYFGDLKMYVHTPETLDEDDPHITCAMHYLGGEYGGNFIAEYVRTAPCGEPHGYQVYGNFDLKGYKGTTWDPLPEETIAAKAERMCVDEAPERLPTVSPFALELTWLAGARKVGMHTLPVLCLVGRAGGTELTKSIVSK